MAYTPPKKKTWSQMTQAEKNAHMRSPQGQRELAAKRSAGTDAATKKAQEDQRVRDYYKTQGHIPTILAHESKRIFNEQNNQDMHELARKVALGQMTLAEAMQLVTRGSSRLDPAVKRAGLSVDAEITPAVKALQRKIDLSKRITDREVGESEKLNKRQQGDLNAVYAALRNSLEGLRAPVDQAYTGARSSMAEALGAATGNINTNYGTAVGGVNSEAARLGLQQAAPDATARLTADQQMLLGLANLNTQAAQNTMSLEQQSVQGDITRNIAGAGRENASLNANALRELSDRVTALRQQHADTEFDLGGEAIDIEGTRFGKVYEATQAIRDAMAQAAQAEEDRLFERQLAVEGLGIKKSGLELEAGRLDLGWAQLDAQNQRAAAQLRLEQAKLDLTAARNAQEAAEARARIAVEEQKIRQADQRIAIDRDRANTEKQRVATQGASRKLSGVSGAEAIIDRYMQQGYGNGNPNVRVGLLEVLQRATQTNMYRSGTMNNNPAELAKLMMSIGRSQGMTATESKILSDMAYAFMGKYN